MEGSLYPRGGGFVGHIEKSFKISYIAVLTTTLFEFTSFFLTFKNSNSAQSKNARGGL